MHVQMISLGSRYKVLLTKVKELQAMGKSEAIHSCLESLRGVARRRGTDYYYRKKGFRAIGKLIDNIINGTFVDVPAGSNRDWRYLNS